MINVQNSVETFDRHACRLEDFRAIVEQPAGVFDSAARVEQGVPIYDADHVRSATTEMMTPIGPPGTSWHRCCRRGRASSCLPVPSKAAWSTVPPTCSMR